MPFVKRDADGRIVALHETAEPGFVEELPASDMELQAYLSRYQAGEEILSNTDLDFVRVLEDLVDVLIAKGVILFTDLPPSAQDKITRRQQLRRRLGDDLNLIEDD